MIPQQPDVLNPKADTPVLQQVLFYRPTKSDPAIDGCMPDIQSPHIVYVGVIQAVNGMQVDLLIGQNAKTQFVLKAILLGEQHIAGQAEWTPYWNKQFVVAAQAQPT